MESNGSREALLKLFKLPYTGILKYYESDTYYIIEIFETFSFSRQRCLYVLKQKQSDIIRWIDFENENAFLSYSLQYLDGNKLIFLAEPTDFAKADSNFKGKLKHPESFEKIDPEGNSVVVVVNLK